MVKIEKTYEKLLRKQENFERLQYYERISNDWFQSVRITANTSSKTKDNKTMRDRKSMCICLVLLIENNNECKASPLCLYGRLLCWCFPFSTPPPPKFLSRKFGFVSQFCLVSTSFDFVLCVSHFMRWHFGWWQWHRVRTTNGYFTHSSTSSPVSCFNLKDWILLLLHVNTYSDTKYRIFMQYVRASLSGQNDGEEEQAIENHHDQIKHIADRCFGYCCYSNCLYPFVDFIV